MSSVGVVWLFSWLCVLLQLKYPKIIELEQVFLSFVHPWNSVHIVQPSCDLIGMFVQFTVKIRKWRGYSFVWKLNWLLYLKEISPTIHNFKKAKRRNSTEAIIKQRGVTSRRVSNNGPIFQKVPGPALPCNQLPLLGKIFFFRRN